MAWTRIADGRLPTCGPGSRTRDRLLDRGIAGEQLEGLADCVLRRQRGRESGGNVGAADLAAAEVLADGDSAAGKSSVSLPGRTIV
jgi:hypothetical protein